MIPMLVQVGEKSCVRADQIGGIHLLDNDYENHGFRIRVDGASNRFGKGADAFARFETREEAKQVYDNLVYAVNWYFSVLQSADAPTEPAPATPEPVQA